jgi:hypothetical protein
MSDIKTLYREDVFAWSKEQAEALRSAARGGSNQKLDWENLAEEIESVGISQLHQLKSHIRRIIEHLLKLQYSRAADPRRGWSEAIDDARDEIEAVLDDSPSLKGAVEAAVAAEHKRGSRKALRELDKHGELDPALTACIRATTYTPDQILGDWFPPAPQGCADDA